LDLSNCAYGRWDFIEAIGLRMLCRKPFLANENLFTAADKLFYNEDKNRKSLFKYWESKKI
tara:strand:+ start:3439 stop:3621 length:183 start_codon:yes stop_codon:yes gene_type:complete